MNYTNDKNKVKRLLLNKDTININGLFHLNNEDLQSKRYKFEYKCLYYSRVM